MVYITNWQEFQEAAEGLYEKSPQITRYCVRWRGSEGVLVLKITDNTTCLKYKTHSSIFLNRFEALNLTMMRKMQNRKAVPVAEELRFGTPDGAPPTPGIGGTISAGSSLVPAPGGTTAGGVKKKKGKKKK